MTDNPFKGLVGYFGVADELRPDDKRLPKYKEQYDLQGWDDTVTWNLYLEMCEWMLPKLRRFKEVSITFPQNLTPESWATRLSLMIAWMELVIEDKTVYTDEENAIMEEGKKLFGEYFYSLWW